MTAEVAGSRDGWSRRTVDDGRADRSCLSLSNDRTGGRLELRIRKVRDPRFVETGSWLARRYSVRASRDGREPRFRFTSREFARLEESIREQGIALLGHDGDENLWWLGGEELYWADQGLGAADVEVLLWDRRRRQEARLSRLHKIRDREQRVEAARRQRIPEEARNFVWHRDEGRCVGCGSTEDLQFDHVIPLARGGGNAVDNLQILCGSCNREKGCSIG